MADRPGGVEGERVRPAAGEMVDPVTRLWGMQRLFMLAVEHEVPEFVGDLRSLSPETDDVKLASVLGRWHLDVPWVRAGVGAWAGLEGHEPKRYHGAELDPSWRWGTALMPPVAVRDVLWWPTIHRVVGLYRELARRGLVSPDEASTVTAIVEAVAPFADAFRYSGPPFDPEHDTRDEYRDRVIRDVGEKAERHMDLMQALAGLVPGVEKTKERKFDHYRWAVRHRVRGDSYAMIARELEYTERARSRAAVQHAAKEILDELFGRPVPSKVEGGPQI